MVCSVNGQVAILNSQNKTAGGKWVYPKMESIAHDADLLLLQYSSDEPYQIFFLLNQMLQD